MGRMRRLLSACVFLLAGSGLASAQDQTPPPTEDPNDDRAELEMLLDAEVTSVSRRVERASDAPATVSVITADEIRRHGFRTIADALRTVPGVFVHYDRVYELAGIRGFGILGDYSTRILILLDGHALNTQMSLGDSYLGTDAPVDMSVIERIEVIKGPASATYGPSAFFGVVNVVTRKGSDLQGGSVEMRAGTFQRREIATVYGRRLANGVDAVVSARFFDSLGPDLTFPEYGEQTVGTDHDRAANVYARTSWEGLSLTFNGLSRRKGLPTAPFEANYGEVGNRYVNKQYFVEAAYRRALGAKVEVGARLHTDQYQYEDFLKYQPDPYYRDRALETWSGGAVDASVAVGSATRVQLGAAGTVHEARIHSFYSDDAASVPAIEESFDTQTVFALVEQRLFADELRLSAGATGYRNSLYDSRVTPKAGVVWVPRPQDTVKLLYGEGFRTPTLFESLFEDDNAFVPNPDIEPEHGRTLELAYERAIGSRARVSIVGHRDQYENLINQFDFEVSPGDTRSQFQNRGRIEAWGTETAVRVDLGSGWYLRGGHAWSQAERHLDGVVERELPNFPEHVVNGAVVGDLHPGRLSVALNGHWVSSRRRNLTDEEAAADPDAVRRVPEYMVGNVSLRSYGWVEGVALQLTVYNFLDTRYRDPVVRDHRPIVAVQQDGRTFQLGVDYRF